MRLGKWIRIYEKTVPIPLAFSSSFQIRQGSVLYLSAIPVSDTHQGGDAEIIISPIPRNLWRSVCRLSVRLSDFPKSLARASRFLQEKSINILLTEAAATFQERAHWDAICDLSQYPEYIKIKECKTYEIFEKEMLFLLKQLTLEINNFAQQNENKGVFLVGQDALAEFIHLPGLNIISYRTKASVSEMAIFTDGAIELPDSIVNFVKTTLSVGNRGSISPVPSHALITGNTEQRYLRLYFIRNVSEFVMAEISCDQQSLDGNGIGVLSQILDQLPNDMNLLHLSVFQQHINKEISKSIKNTLKEKTALTHLDLKKTQGRLKIICHWPNHQSPQEDEKNLSGIIKNIEIIDLNGTSHSNLCELIDYATPNFVNPRIFISYSCINGLNSKEDKWRLNILRNTLIEHNFDPIFGVNIGDNPVIGRHPVSPDVMHSALEKIATCVGFISLQTKREDFVTNDNRFILPPWLIAEEVFAFSKGLCFLVRLTEKGIDDPRYNKNVFQFDFTNRNDYREKVKDLVSLLNRLRQQPEFENYLAASRSSQYIIKPTSE